MTGTDQVGSQRAHGERVLRGLPLPGHVILLTDSGWRRGWLLARENRSTGWIGLVQYDDGDGEITTYLPADRIASPDLWLTESRAPRTPPTCLPS